MAALKISEIKYENHERRCRICMEMFKARQKRIKITKNIESLFADLGLEVNINFSYFHIIINVRLHRNL